MIIARSEGRGLWMDYVLRKIMKIAFPDKTLYWGKDDATFAVVSYFEHQEPIDRNSLLPYIVWCGENSFTYPPERAIKKHPPLAVFHTSLEAKKDFTDVPFFHLPFAVFRKLNNNRIREVIGGDRPEFMAYVASNPIPMRDDTFRLFQSVGANPLAYGRCCKNVQGLFGGGYDNLSHIYSRHRFALTFENCDEPGYITEKIVNAYIAGSIPVYWGSQGFVRTMFNPQSFIYLSDFQSPEAMVDYVMKVDRDKDLLQSYQFAPVFRDDFPSEYFDFETPSKPIQEIAEFFQHML